MIGWDLLPAMARIGHKDSGVTFACYAMVRDDMRPEGKGELRAFVDGGVMIEVPAVDLAPAPHEATT